MSDRPSACLTGCTIRGQHRPDATDHDEACRGCLPRPADIGNLCEWCTQRLHSDVATAPSLVRHLRDLAEPHAGAKPPGDGRSHRDPSEGSVLSGAVDAADEVHACLASWAVLILEDHPNGAAMTGPDERGAWLTKYGAVAGVRTPSATTRLVAWLTPWLDWCAGQEWAGEMRREIGQLIATTSARWPTEDYRERPVPGVACPRCDALSLTYTPPRWATAPFVVACVNPECGRTFSEDEWTRLVTLLGIAERVAG